MKALHQKNTNTVNYYENVPIDILYKYTVQGGLNTGCDIELIYPYIKHTQSLIEVGAGYGRVIHHLLCKGYSGNLYALERSLSLCSYLKQKYSHQAKIIHDDLQSFQPIKKFDVVLWLWSSITEFSKSEQFTILKHLASWLSSKGILIIETLHYSLVPTNATEIQDQFHVLSSPYGKIYGYTPSTKEIYNYVKMLNFKYTHCISYKTTTNRNRILYFFSYVPLITLL